LYFFGGIYIDCDFLCLKNIDNIIENYDGISGYESNEFIAIGILGFIKHDNILLNIIKGLVYNIEEDNYKKLNKTIPELTGPVFFTSIWLKYKTEKHYAFKQEYFYSYTFKIKIIIKIILLVKIIMQSICGDIHGIKNKKKKITKETIIYYIFIYPI